MSHQPCQSVTPHGPRQRPKALRLTPPDKPHDLREAVAVGRPHAPDFTSRGGRFPSRISSTCSAANRAMFSRDSSVAPAVCGLTSTLSKRSSGWSCGGGSSSHTSRPAPAIRRVCQRVGQRILIVDEAARRGDEPCLRPHQRETVPHRSCRAIRGSAGNAPRRNPPSAATRPAPPSRRRARGSAPRSNRVVGEHAHVEQTAAQFGDPAADIADADHADGAVQQLAADILVARNPGPARMRRSVSMMRLDEVGIIARACSATPSLLPPDWFTTAIPWGSAGIHVHGVVARAVG